MSRAMIAKLPSGARDVKPPSCYEIRRSSVGSLSEPVRKAIESIERHTRKLWVPHAYCNGTLTVAPRRERHIYMMMRRLTVLGALTCGLAAAACGGSSAVNPKSSPSFALGSHFDSLAIEASNNHFFDRYRLLAYPTAGLMQNVTPSTIALSVDGSSQSYQGLVLELVGTTAGSNPTPADSIYAISVWSDSNVSDLVFTEIAQPDTLEDAEDLAGTSAIEADSASVLSISLPSATNKCNLFTPPEPNAAVTSLTAGTTCTQGVATAAFTLFFTPTGANTHHVYTMASQSINAARIVLPANTGGTERIRALLAAQRHRPMVVRSSQ